MMRSGRLGDLRTFLFIGEHKSPAKECGRWGSKLISWEIKTSMGSVLHCDHMLLSHSQFHEPSQTSLQICVIVVVTVTRYTVVIFILYRL